jgi:hypothetical protein
MVTGASSNTVWLTRVPVMARSGTISSPPATTGKTGIPPSVTALSRSSTEVKSVALPSLKTSTPATGRLR